jgi:hypothetical protein
MVPTNAARAEKEDGRVLAAGSEVSCGTIMGSLKAFLARQGVFRG